MSESDTEENLPPPTKERRPPVIIARCGECIFFNREAVYAKPCSELGIGKLGRVCSKFMPNVYGVLDTDIVQTVMKLKDNQLRMICALAYQETNTRKQGTTWGDKVYFRLVGDDYISNYMSGLILAGDETHYFLMGEDGQVKAKLLHASVYFPDRWKRKRASLKKRGKLVDPNFKSLFKVVKKPRITDKYEPPTLDEFNAKPVKEEEESVVRSTRGRKSK